MNQPKFRLGQVVTYVYAIHYGVGVLTHACRVDDVQSQGTEFFYKVNSNWFPESKLKEALS